MVHHLEIIPVDSAEIKKGTKYDPVLSTVVDMVVLGQFVGTDTQSDALAPLYMRRDKLTVSQGCLLWSSRVVVPPALRPQLLKELHARHPGVVRMKAIAWSYTWWPGLDAQIEQWAKMCTPGHGQGPHGKQVHVDFGGPFKGHMFLVAVDACAGDEDDNN